MTFRLLSGLLAFAVTVAAGEVRAAEADPATEPAVLAVKKALPAVVNINTERVVQKQVRDPYREQFFGGPASRPLTLRQKVQSLGTGFIIDSTGYIVTNEHVVEQAADLKISVTTATGKTYSARYITGTSESDLALIKIDDADPLPYIDLQDLSPTLLGQTVLVLGNPLGYGSSVARGILSAKGRTITVQGNEYRNLLQTDAAINPGNSGGPIIDLAGRLVGVASVKLAYTQQGVPTQGLGFAIPGDTVRTKVEQFKKATSGKPAKEEKPLSLSQKYFGLQLQDLTPKLRKEYNVPDGSGVLIAEVEARSPAAEMSLERGLVIYQVGRFEVSSVKQIEELLESIAAGSLVDFTVGIVRRNARRQLQPVTLVAR